MVKQILSVTAFKKKPLNLLIFIYDRSKLCHASKYKYIYSTASNWRKFPLNSISYVKGQRKKHTHYYSEQVLKIETTETIWDIHLIQARWETK